MYLLDIVWPTIFMVALIFAVWITMFIARRQHMKANPPTLDDFASGAAASRYFAPVEMPSNNFKNLFEMPVLFFALVPLLITTGLDTDVQGGLAWAYVILRAAHSYVHIGPKKVQLRSIIFLLSSLVLLAMWICFTVGYMHAMTAPDLI